MKTNQTFWDSIAEKYAKRPVKDMAAYDRTIERAKSHLSQTDVALEVGCGTGTTALRLAGSVQNLTASDISAKMIEIANHKKGEQQVTNVTFVQGTLSSDALSAETFDAVLAFNFLHLLEDLPQALQRVHQLLKPNGMFISKTVCLGGKKEFFLRPLIFVMQKVGSAPFVDFIKASELEEMMSASGFKIIETTNYPEKSSSRFIVAQKI